MKNAKQEQNMEGKMKVICVLGSPRADGNSATIAGRFRDIAEGMGAEVRSFILNQLDFKGCQGCMACKTTSDRCVVKDDLAQVLDAVYEADIVVTATPVYMGWVSGQFKSFLDRAYSFLGPDYLTNPDPSRLSKGKKMVYIMTQGNPSEEMFKDARDKTAFLFERLGFEKSHIIHGCDLKGPEDAGKREDLLSEAEKLAADLCKSA